MSYSPYDLRPATADDQNAINCLIRAVGINPLGLDWRRFVVAVDETGTIIGCGQVKPHRDGSRELASVAVHKRWRDQGIARAIIERLMAEHPPPLWLMCRSSLVPLYQKFGFREVTAAKAMPPYFRLIKLLFSLFSWLIPGQDHLAVMSWRNPPS